jgi:hypothetical protein
MKHQLVDVVTIRLGSPQRLLRCQTANRTSKIGPMPRLLLKSTLDDLEQKLDLRIFRHGAPPI